MVARESVRRWLELVLGFGVFPAVVGLWVTPAWWVPALWVIAAGAWVVLWRDAGVRPHGFWAPVEWARAGPELRRVLARFAVSAVAVSGAVAWWAPEWFLRFPRERPGMWLLVSVAYPVLSVYPQELLYRRFFFHRMTPLFGESRALVAASALTFGAMHLIFQNALAVACTLVGGWLFADTYRRTGSLRLVCLKHALYGNLMFTVGLGDFFFSGAVR